MSSADPFNRPLSNALKMWDTVPAAMAEKLVPCPVCHGNGYVLVADVAADCEHCNSQGEVTSNRAVKNGD